MSQKFKFDKDHLARLLGQQSEDVNFAYSDNPKVNISIKGKRKVKLIAKAWLCGCRGYKWFTVTLGQYEPNATGLEMLTRFVSNADPQLIFKLIQQDGK